MQDENQKAIGILTDDITIMMRLLDRYDLNYGDTQIVETPRHFVIYTYNGGWSENEDVDTDMMLFFDRYLIHDLHPIRIYLMDKEKFIRIIDNQLFVVRPPKEIWQRFRENGNYKMQDAFNYTIEVD